MSSENMIERKGTITHLQSSEYLTFTMTPIEEGRNLTVVWPWVTLSFSTVIYMDISFVSVIIKCSTLSVQQTEKLHCSTSLQ